MNIYPKYLEDTKKQFNFLTTEFGFVLASEQEKEAGVWLEYVKNDRHIRLGFELIESRFFYSLIQGEKHVMFHEYFHRYDETINWPVLMPNFEDYEEALEKNATLLKKYGTPFLSEKEDL